MEIVSIILRLKNQEIKVTVDEAKELLGQLTAVFGGEKPIIITKTEKEYVPYPVYPVYPVYPQYPQYPWWTKPWWEYQPVVIYDTGVRAVPQWSDNTCNLIIEGTGTILSSTTYKIGGETSGTSWVDKSGKSILGDQVSSSSITIN